MYKDYCVYVLELCTILTEFTTIITVLIISPHYNAYKFNVDIF